MLVGHSRTGHGQRVSYARRGPSDLLSGLLANALDPVATLDDIRLETNRTSSAMELQEEPAGVTQYGA